MGPPSSLSLGDPISRGFLARTLSIFVNLERALQVQRMDKLISLVAACQAGGTFLYLNTNIRESYL